MLNTHLSSACNDKKKLLNHENVLNQINYASFFFFQITAQVCLCWTRSTVGHMRGYAVWFVTVPNGSVFSKKCESFLSAGSPSVNFVWGSMLRVMQ